MDNHEKALKILREKLQEYNELSNTCPLDNRRHWLAGHLHGMCQAFCMAGLIDSADWAEIEDGMK